MKFWVIVAFAAIVVVGYVLLYSLNALEAQGSGALGLVNLLGLAAVAIGIVAAGLVMRRFSKPA